MRTDTLQHVIQSFAVRTDTLQRHSANRYPHRHTTSHLQNSEQKCSSNVLQQFSTSSCSTPLLRSLYAYVFLERHGTTQRACRTYVLTACTLAWRACAVTRRRRRNMSLLACQPAVSRTCRASTLQYCAPSSCGQTTQNVHSRNTTASVIGGYEHTRKLKILHD